ncbi:plastid delta12-fatty acid acetylenase [Tanacetum coccineum]|uniref:Plastid delta12-fatty acid acetylenase n=1 Tax=Tanacetum coccineum TaxID=301880 RepID=A0ABQ5CYT6_9ASTR
MGAGGRMSDSSEETKDLLKRVPIEPPFSLSDLKKAIPAHCFERSVIRSSYYVVHDLIVTYVFYFLANTYIPSLPSPLAYLAWPVYWFCQASILTGYRVKVLVSDLGLLGVFYAIKLLVAAKGFAWEARDAIKPVLGEFYKIDRTPIFKAMWREAKECIYIEPDEGSKHEGVYWYHKM